MESLALLLAAAMAVVLCIPDYGLAYVFDDINFLARGQTFRLAYLLPEHNFIFWRPVSREIYFGLLNFLSPSSPLLGHILNGVLLGAVVWVLGRFAQRLIGKIAGIYAAILLASFGQLPVLVAWVCGSQDILAMLFTAVALDLELQRRGGWATLALVLAVLSKETAVVIFPAFLMVRWLGSQSKKETTLTGVRLVALAAVWLTVHPGIRILLGNGWTSPTGGYVGLHNPDRWNSLLRSIPVLFNLPLTGYRTIWMGQLNPVGAAAAVLLFASWIASAPARTSEGPSAAAPSARWIVGLGALLAIPPLLLTSLLLQRWGPYYMCFSAMGVVLPLGLAISSMPRRSAALCLVAFLLLGLWSRGIKMDPKMQTELNLAPAGRALLTVEANFKRVAPSLPKSAVIYVATMVTGSRSVYVHMYWFQVLRIWYRDPTLQVVRPELRVLSPNPEFLFFIDQDLNVFRIDPLTLSITSSGPPAEGWRYRRVLLSWSIGLAASGDVGRAVQILLGPNGPGTPGSSFARRVAATLLAWRGDPAEANSLLEGLPPLSVGGAVRSVASLITVPTRGTPLDDYALTAFGLPKDDPGVLRTLMMTLLNFGYYEPSKRLAERLLALRPSDAAAASALRKINSLDKWTVFVTPPIPSVGFPEGR